MRRSGVSKFVYTLQTSVLRLTFVFRIIGKDPSVDDFDQISNKHNENRTNLS